MKPSPIELPDWFQLMLWGAIWAGEVEKSASISEFGDAPHHIWDNPEYAKDAYISDGGRWEPVPEWWALPYVGVMLSEASWGLLI